jgi:hypothetical protein
MAAHLRINYFCFVYVCVSYVVLLLFVFVVDDGLALGSFGAQHLDYGGRDKEI